MAIGDCESGVAQRGSVFEHVLIEPRRTSFPLRDATSEAPGQHGAPVSWTLEFTIGHGLVELDLHKYEVELGVSCEHVYPAMVADAEILKSVMGQVDDVQKISAVEPALHGV